MDEVEIVPRIPNFLESDQTGQEEDVAERVTTVPVATGVVEPTIPGEAKVDDEDNENEESEESEEDSEDEENSDEDEENEEEDDNEESESDEDEDENESDENAE